MMRLDVLKKTINFLVPKCKNYIYALPHSNGLKDHYDLLNSNSDNLLTALKYMYSTESIPMVVHLECYDAERIPKIQQYLDTQNHGRMKIKLIASDLAAGNKTQKRKRKIHNLLIRYRCALWLSDAGHCSYFDKVRQQKFICLNYSSPFKSATNIDIYGDLSYIDGFLETSLLAASVDASEYYIRIANCPILGFPRNDTLFCNKKAEIVRNWISSTTSVTYRHIIVYAPTYRDYSNAYSTDCVFGFLDNDNEVGRFLEDNQILVIAKLHPLQDTSSIKYSDHIVCYEASYDYSLYDVLALSDMLISDYSSVVHDYIITGKPVILDFFDRDRYDETRGFAFEPIDYICPGPIVETREEMLEQISLLLVKPEVSEQYARVAAMFHRYLCDGSTERVVSYLEGCINNGK